MQTSLEPLAVPKAGYRVAAYQAIKDAILSGYLEQGMALIEDDIATRLQVSRTPVREALAILQHEGLISPRSGRGFHVRQVAREEFIEIFVANEVIEPYLVRRAAIIATEENLREIENALNKSKQYVAEGDLAGTLRAGRDFHKCVGVASGNMRLTRFIISNEERIDLYLLGSGRGFDVASWIPSNQEHEMIFNAIVQRDPDTAARLVAYHSQSVRERLAPLFNEEGSENEAAAGEVFPRRTRSQTR